MILVPAAAVRVATVVLYAVGFVLQVVGGGLVAIEVWEDIRAARRIASGEDVADAPPTFVASGRRVTTIIGGVAGRGLARTAHEVDAFRVFTVDRLSGRLGRRVLGVALIFIGAAVGLPANLTAAL